MSDKPRGQGRSAGLNGQRAQQERARENWVALCVQPTGRPEPEWFSDRSKLPKKPPSRPKLPESGE